MSLFVALQSVLYYVLACSACRQCAYQRKRKREAILAKQRHGGEGDLETGNLSSYRHTSPFSTNIYWREELALGPGPSQKRSGKDGKGSQQRRVPTGGTGSSVASNSSHGEPLGHAGAASPPPESTRVEDWYYKHHQREDEVLWGCQQDSSQDQANTGHPPRKLLHGRTETASQKSYSRVRGPPLTELHPPVVSRHSSDKNELRWMLQPPPNARIMSGKEVVKRDRSGSGSSRTTGDLSLGKQLGVRLMEEKKRSTAGTSLMERSDSQHWTGQGQYRDRNVVVRSDDVDEETSELQTKECPSLPVWRISAETAGRSGLNHSNSSDTTLIHANANPSKVVDVLQPPKLSFPTNETTTNIASPNSSTSSSLHILQELIPPENTNNTALDKHSRSPSPHSFSYLPNENNLRPSITEKHHDDDE